MTSKDETKEPSGKTGGDKRGGADGKAKAAVPEPKSKTETADNRSKEVPRKM